MSQVVTIKDLSSSKSTYIYKYRLCFIINFFYERYKFPRKQTCGRGGKTKCFKTPRINQISASVALNDSTKDKWISPPEALVAGGTGWTGIIQWETSPPCTAGGVSEGSHSPVLGTLRWRSLRGPRLDTQRPGAHRRGCRHRESPRHVNVRRPWHGQAIQGDVSGAGGRRAESETPEGAQWKRQAQETRGQQREAEASTLPRKPKQGRSLQSGIAQPCGMWPRGQVR